MSGTFIRDGLELAYRDEGDGTALIFQHGLGADAGQPFEIIGGMEGFRRITLECRGHGGSDLGPVDELSIATFADDLLALMDHLEIKRVIVGGISMGAAITARLAKDAPERVEKLILARPAWTFDAAPPNMEPFAVLADLLHRYGAEEAKVQLPETDAYRALQAVSPDNAASLLAQCDRPRPAADTAALLGRIARDSPGLSRADFATLTMPALVIGNAQDAVHPLSMAADLAAVLPDARFAEIPAKSESREGHTLAFQAAVSDFVAASDMANAV